MFESKAPAQVPDTEATCPVSIFLLAALKLATERGILFEVVQIVDIYVGAVTPGNTL